MLRKGLFVAAAATALSVAGCGAQGAQTHSSSVTSEITSACPSPIDNTAFFDRKHDFSSISELARASTAVVVARATDHVRTDYLAPDTPVTVTTMEVSKVLRGSTPSSSIQLRQLGSPTVCIDAASTIVEAGDTYVVALTPHVGGPNSETTSEYNVTGTPQGLFALDQARQVVKRLDPGAKKLPAERSFEQFSEEVAR